MRRGPLTVRQADVARAVRGALSGGLKVARVEIGPDGRIVLISGEPAAPEPASPFDEWKAGQDARSPEGS